MRRRQSVTSGVSKIDIHETSEQLLKLMKQQKQRPLRERVQALYLLKSQAADSIAPVARILGHNRVTVQRWLIEYPRNGLDGLLAVKARGGRQAAIPPGAQTKQAVGYFRTYLQIESCLRQLLSSR